MKSFQAWNCSNSANKGVVELFLVAKQLYEPLMSMNNLDQETLVYQPYDLKDKWRPSVISYGPTARR